MAIRGQFRHLIARLRGLARDERGDALEYILVLAVFALPMWAISSKLLDILSDYFAMIAFYVGWPFL